MAILLKESHGFTDAIDPDLAEWDYGEYEGRRTAEIRQAVPDWTIWRYGAPAGESPEEVGARADRVVADRRPADRPGARPERPPRRSTAGRHAARRLGRLTGNPNRSR